jgi:stage V sporulation protein G
MQITDIRVRVVNADSKMKAVVSVTFDDAFVVHDIKVIEGEKGMFIAMPSKKTPTGEYRDIAHPIHGEMRAMLQDAILDGYQNSLRELAEEAE